jgi:DNA-binding HxlR family transcriptional regulator
MILPVFNYSLTQWNVIAATWVNDTPLSEVIRTLERKYDVSFHIKDPEALKYTYTLTTRQTSLEEILSELQKIAPVKFRKKGTEIEVSLS